MRVIDCERLDGFCVAGFGAVDGDEMENAVVTFAVHSKADTDDHGEEYEEGFVENDEVEVGEHRCRPNARRSSQRKSDRHVNVASSVACSLCGASMNLLRRRSLRRPGFVHQYLAQNFIVRLAKAKSFLDPDHETLQ